MTLEELRAFSRTAEAGGVSAAARALGVPKSNVSRLISSLESKLHVSLLQRSTRGSVLTQEGHQFLAHARRILDEVGEAETSFASYEQVPRGLLKVTAPPTFGARFLAPLLPQFLVRAPEVRLDLRLTSSQVDLAEEGVDLAIRIGSPASSSLVMRRLAPNPILLCASPAYLEREGSPTTPSQLIGHRLLLHARFLEDVRLPLSREQEHLRLAVTASLTSNDPSVLVEATLAGMGIGEIPMIIARQQLEGGQLIEVLPGWRLPETEIFALFHPSRRVAPRVRSFVDFLVETLKPSL